MNFTETISIIAIVISFASFIISLSAFIISVLNYRRDRYKVIVDLDWDSGTHHIGMRSNVVETWGKITVRNEGRRSVSLRTIGIRYPDSDRVYSLLKDENAEGIKLNEHDWIEIKVPQDNLLKRYSKDWEKLYAVANDISGKEYKSGKPWNKPSWAE
jgi:hypothetical protein